MHHLQFFFDIDEDGTSDILVLSDQVNNTESKLTISGIYNYQKNDAYFLKAIGLNGVCTQRCKQGAWLPEPKPYGVNQFGATLKFTYNDNYGVRHIFHISQLSQNGFNSLQTPYTLAGLDRSSNYIDFLFLGVPSCSNQKNNYFSWPGIIPNSQIVSVPYPPNAPDEWVIELYLNPSGYTLWIALSAVAALIGIGIAICVLDKKEKKQDEEEQQMMFSFAAL